MIRKLIRSMLTAQIFSALTVSVCLLIDNIMIGRFLGEEAIAAYGLSNPLLLLVGGVASLLSAGVQVSCSKSLGKGSREETNAGFSSALAVAVGFSVPVLILVFLLIRPLTTLLGAGTGGSLYDQTRGYLIGFNLGGPATVGALVLVPFLQLAGRSGLLIAAVLGMTVTDIVLDLLNVLVFHGGMFGMGLASALSYYVALIIGGSYFLTRGCSFRFSRKLVSFRKIRELFRDGLPSGFNALASVILVYVMNQILSTAGGSSAVAAFAVISSLGNSFNCISTGIGGVSLTLTGIFYHEEDRGNLRETVILLCRYGVFLGLAMGILIYFLAPPLAGLLLPKEGTAWRTAVLGMRLFAAGLIPCTVINALKYAYQGTGRVALMGGISLTEGAVLQVLSALVLGRIFGLPGALMYFCCGELLAVILICVYIRIRSGRAPWRGDTFLLLKDDFGVAADRLLEMNIQSLEEAAAAARKAEAFCRSHGQSGRLTNHIALCVEEMAAFTIEHGFQQDGRKHHLFLRILRKEDGWILRFRDDCRPFDPTVYIADQEYMGIRMVQRLAEEANYTYSLNMNNLTLKLPAESGDKAE